MFNLYLTSMKNKSILLALAMVLSIGTAQAQGLGGFLKKVNKGLEKITGTTSSDNSSSTSTSSSAAAVATEWGGTMVNPAAKVMDVELVGLYGVKKTANFGNVYAVLRITVKIVKDRISLGGKDGGAKTVAFDADGNQYSPYDSSGGSFTISEGVPVKCDLSSKGRKTFEDVPITTKAFKKMKIDYYLDAQYRGYNGGAIEFNDVPIKWDVDEE